MARPKRLERRHGLVPQQDRGERRYQELLDAAEAVITEVGVSAATTNAIAARAGSGMASLYRFFPNKEAIVAALATRYNEAMLQVTRFGARPDLTGMSLGAMVDAIVDPLVEFFRCTPAYRHVFHAVDDPGLGRESVCELKETVVAQVEILMAARAPQVPAPLRRIHAMVAVELVHRMLAFAFAQGPRKRRPLIAETKRLLVLYSEMIQRGDDPLTRLA